MKRALISPKEQNYDGARIVQVVDEKDEFPVAPPMRWIDCADDVTPETHYARGNVVTANPAPVIPPPSQRDVDRADALAKVRDAAQDAGIPPKVRAALAALEKIL